MEFRGTEGIVIDVLRTPELQRLRRIRQLGLAYLVFPGAEHSRLAHSLGASYVGVRFGRHLTEATEGQLASLLAVNEDAVRDLAVAALCHDLGHGPLSHVWEHEAVGPAFDRDAWIKGLDLATESSLLASAGWHEIVGQGLLAWQEGRLHQLLERNEVGSSKRVRYMLMGVYPSHPYLPRLLSSDVDVDRADFLIRDAYQSGVAYGRFDLPWLISTCGVGEDDRGELVIGFDKRKGSRVVEQFLIARAAHYDMVYHHKTVRAAEGMVGILLRRLREVKLPSRYARDAFSAPVSRIVAGEVLKPNELLSLDDYQLWVFLTKISEDDKADRIARDLAGRILSRELFKLVPASSESITRFLRDPDAWNKIYSAVAAFVPGSPEHYVHLDTSEFSVFSKKVSQEVFLITDGSRATVAREEEPLRHYDQGPATNNRLFTVAGEAVEALARLLAKSPTT